MRFFDYAIAFLAAFALVFAGIHIATGETPLRHAEAGMNQIGGFMVGGALADEPAGPAIAFDKLLRIPDHELVIGPEVDTTVLSLITVTKIGFGRPSNVDVVRTPSGTYSTDGLRSVNVKYAGLESVHKPSSSDAGMIYWEPGFGWMQVPLTGKSFVRTHGRTSDGSYATTNAYTCVRGDGYKTCN